MVVLSAKGNPEVGEGQKPPKHGTKFGRRNRCPWWTDVVVWTARGEPDVYFALPSRFSQKTLVHED